MPLLSRIALASILFEGGLGLLAVGLAWAVGVSLGDQIAWQWDALWWGTAAALPAVAAAVLGMHVPWRPLVRLRALVEETIVPLFRDCSLIDLAVIALAACVSEELFFRGLVQAWSADIFGTGWGLAVGSLVFGLFHPISRTYVVLAVVMGAWLGWLWIVSGNLLTAIVCHAVYDYLALIYLTRRARSGERPKNNFPV
ncbi:MAG: CPBP family intramembrane metalloprotease [Planctomycetes bacterium]|nr:CPBP family intramembrane metalloprotease [Planctomycetota bacterium]